MRNGSSPTSLPDIQVWWPARATSSAISAPEFPAPAMRTPPSRSCDGLRYSRECSWTMPGSSPCAHAGTRPRWNVAIATTTFSASSRSSPISTTNRSPRLESRSTRTPVRTGSRKRAAYASRYAAISSFVGK